MFQLCITVKSISVKLLNVSNIEMLFENERRLFPHLLYYIYTLKKYGCPIKLYVFIQIQFPTNEQRDLILKNPSKYAYYCTFLFELPSGESWHAYGPRVFFVSMWREYYAVNMITRILPSVFVLRPNGRIFSNQKSCYNR